MQQHFSSEKKLMHLYYIGYPELRNKPFFLLKITNKNKHNNQAYMLDK